jgi:hypothetical protein
LEQCARRTDDSLLEHICCGWFGQEGSDPGWIKAGDAVRAELVQFRSGPSGYMIGNEASDGRGQSKAVPGTKGQRQPFQPGEAAKEE